MPLITFEGIDQSGKSTQLELLARAARESGQSVITTREPGGTPLGDRIRTILLGPEHAGMDSWAEALLYAAARAQLVQDIVNPALAEGAIVISDRYIDSSLAYQGIARGLGVQRVLELNNWATGGLLPDLTILLRIEVDVSRNRLLGRGEGSDRIESEPLEFHRRVEEGYHEIEAMFPERIVGINGSDSPEEIHRQIVAICLERLGWELGQTDSTKL